MDTVAIMNGYATVPLLRLLGSCEVLRYLLPNALVVGVVSKGLDRSRAACPLVVAKEGVGLGEVIQLLVMVWSPVV